MSHHAHSPMHERAARHERLRLLCEADRARLRLVWRMPTRVVKPPTDEGPWTSSLLAVPALGALLPMMPGRIGRFGRLLGHGTTLLRSMLRSSAA